MSATPDAPADRTGPVLDRRTFLRATGAGLAALGASHGTLHAKSPRDVSERRPALVVLYLRGGVDPLGTLVPYEDKRYRELRPTLAIDPEEHGGHVLDGRFALHPALEALVPFWEAKQLAPIVNTGSPHPTRSHFDAQDFMEYAAPGRRDVRAGWLNRYLAASAPREGEGAGLRAVAMQGLLPRSLRGDVPVLAVPHRRVRDDEGLLGLFEKLYGDEGMEGLPPEGGGDPAQRAEVEPVHAAGRATLEALARYRDVLAVQEARTDLPAVRYPDSALGVRLRDLARILRGEPELEVAALDLVGWDTHTRQGSTAATIPGDLPVLLRELGDGLAAFLTDLGPRLARTLVLVVSEFGRTCAENGNYGTDHGHGALFLLAGGGVRGGEVHGRWKGLKDSALHDGRDLPVETDFRDVFAEVLRSHLDFDLPRGFFPDHRPARLRDLF